MTIQSIIDLHNYICDKEQKGLTLTPENVNTLLPSVQWELFTDEMNNLVKDELTPIAGELVSYSPLNPFKTITSLGTLGGVATAPLDYVRFLSFNTSYNGGLRDVVPVSSKQFSSAQNNIYARPDIRPVLKITSLAGRFIFSLLPNDVSTLNMDYLRTPATPYYDYCQDAITGEAIYMPVGSYIRYGMMSPIYVLYDHDGNTLTSDVTKSGIIMTTQYNSLTVELEWEQRIYPTFVLRLLAKSGLNLSEEKLTQYAEAKLKENA
jgi:hypothetical protein